MAGMRPKDTKDRDLGNFDNSPNFNWRSILLFVAYTSVVLGFFLFSRNENDRESAIQNRETRSASAVRSALPVRLRVPMRRAGEGPGGDLAQLAGIASSFAPNYAPKASDLDTSLMEMKRRTR